MMKAFEPKNMELLLNRQHVCHNFFNI